MAGFRSPFFIWVGGLTAPGGSGPTPPIPPDPTPPGCVCVDYTQDPTLVNAFAVDTPPSNVAYTKTKTLINAWTRGACE
jgi:hypothetical protein